MKKKNKLTLIMYIIKVMYDRFWVTVNNLIQHFKNVFVIEIKKNIYMNIQNKNKIKSCEIKVSFL